MGQIENQILIIHSRVHSADRRDNVKELLSLSSNSRVIDAKFDFSNEEILYWTDMNNFLAMPVIMYTEKVITRVGCLLSHLDALKFIVKFELNNVIILEDDAHIKMGMHTDFVKIVKEKTDSDDYIVYLGYSQNPKNDMVYCCHSYMIPSWKKAKIILDTINETQQKKAIDSLLVKLVQKAGLPYSFFDFFGQNNGYSYIDKKDKKKPGTWKKH